jgi:NADH-ubiquinone oxidoreductase chain 6
MNTILLDLLAFCSILSGILVITSKNPIISVLFLIAVFVNIACYLILLGINFIGLTYLIIYVGAIAILFLFVVIILNIKLVELNEINENKIVPLAIILGGLFLITIYQIFLKINISNNLFIKIFDLINLYFIENKLFNFSNLLETFNNLNNLWDNSFNYFDQISSIGLIIYTTYSLWFIISSCILLLAIIGPIVLCLKNK